MIRILEDHVVNQIAAGEVVERPASVVKELVENSLDAGARRLRIDLQEGGAGLVRVRDDGIGMSSSDAGLCLERHATSKIRNADDLVGVGSLGFRGEAIPSIAAVSRFTLQTRRKQDEAGTRVGVEGGRISKIEACGGPPGTRVSVAELFYNLPARRKFLRTTQTELGHCTETIVRQLLNHPEVDVELTHDGKRVIRAPVHERMNQRAAALLGATGRQLVSIERGGGDVRLSGLISPIGVHRGTARGGFYLYVNGRFVRDPVLRRAISEAYAGLVPRGRYPVVVLRLEVAGADVDVNVHPAKTEVRFRDPNALSRWISSSVRSCLSEAGVPDSGGEVAVSYDTSSQGVQRGLLFGEREPEGSGSLQKGRAEAGVSPTILPPESLVPRAPGPKRSPSLLSSGRPKRPDWSSSRFLGYLDSDTIICRSQGELWILDRSAMERTRVENALEKAADSLPVLVPIVEELSADGWKRIMDLSEDLRDLGFDIEDFGSHTIRIKAIPRALEGGNPRTMLNALCKAKRGKCTGRSFALSILSGRAGESAAAPMSAFEMRERVDGMLADPALDLTTCGFRVDAHEIAQRLGSARNKGG